MSLSVAIIDYGSGNLRSVAKAIERAAVDEGVNADVTVTADPADVRAADHVVLPGVGAFRACANGLAAVDGMIEALNEAVLSDAKPFLGICVGMQLLADRGLEFGETAGLGWIRGSVRSLSEGRVSARIPHMGWNEITVHRDHPALALSASGTDVYFLHSYYFDAENIEDVVAVCDYEGQFPAVVARDNILGFQFHPEKSQAAGLGLIRAFLRWRP